MLEYACLLQRILIDQCRDIHIYIYNSIQIYPQNVQDSQLFALNSVFKPIIICVDMYKHLLFDVLICACVLGISMTTPAKAEQPKRVCVIGAGYSGLGTARFLQQYGLNFTVFEATRYIGGTWRFDPHVGQDDDGVPIFTSMYRNFRTSTPRQTMEYRDFPFSENTPTYPSGVCFYNYLERFTAHFGLKKFIQFRSVVTAVKRELGQWKLTYTKTNTNEEQKETCDFIVVANGYYNKPKIPKFKGHEIFRGSMIHSHDYKEAMPYLHRSVLIVGAGETGIDLAFILSNVTSRLFLSRRQTHHENISAIIKPGIKRFTTNGVVFEDGTSEDIDDVIFCTGFEFEHGFLDESSGLAMSPKSLMPLYQHIVNIQHPSMVFVGKAKTMFTRLFDAQAEYVAALAAGNFKLPTKEVMTKSWTDHVYSILTNGFDILRVNTVKDPDKYLQQLHDEAGVNRTPIYPDYLQRLSDYNTRYNLGEDVC